MSRAQAGCSIKLPISVLNGIFHHLVKPIYNLLITKDSSELSRRERISNTTDHELLSTPTDELIRRTNGGTKQSYIYIYIIYDQEEDEGEEDINDKFSFLSLTKV